MRRILAPVVAALLLIAAAAPASAAPAPAPASAAPAPAASAPTASPAASPATVVYTQDTAGYIASGTTSLFTSVSAIWSETATTCSSTGSYDTSWIGLDGWGGGTASIEAAGVDTDCDGPAPAYAAWYDMYPAPPVYLDPASYPVTVGDPISAQVVYSGGAFQVTMSDPAKGWTYHTSATDRYAKRTSAEAVLQATPGEFPDFGRVNFTNVTVNGAKLSTFNPVQYNASTPWFPEAVSTPITNGNLFTVVWEHA
jgi:hypothetical protein